MARLAAGRRLRGPAYSRSLQQCAHGREWFPLTLTDPREFWSGVTYAAPKLDAFLDRELAQYSLPASQLGLVGFSQGAMMALHIGLRREPALAAIIGYSGLLVLRTDRGSRAFKGHPGRSRRSCWSMGARTM
nr:hypothetical protein [Microvirga sp. 3-52]